MKTRAVHTLILGGGPAGLAAGYTLAKAGRSPVLLERDKVCGGLMRSIHRGDYVVDVGRKELYNRIERVDKLWSDLLGEDYRTYPHRGGFLFDGHILEMTPTFKGIRRGMPWSMFLGCGIDLLWSRVKYAGQRPANVEEYFYQTRGKRLTRIASQAYQEKLTGVRWAEVPLPEDFYNGNGNGAGTGLFSTLKAAVSRALSTKEVNTFEGIWRHPAKGTGQICDAMAKEMIDAGGSIHYLSKVTAMSSNGNRVDSVTAEIDGDVVFFNPEHVISSVPLEVLLSLLGIPVPPAPNRKGVASIKRTVVLAYLFLDREPLFPHAWLQTTDPSTRMGRITNYSGFNSDMVPKGKGCVCCEYYCYGDDPLLQATDDEIIQSTLQDSSRLGLIDPESLADQLVLRLPGADASQNRDNWMSERRLTMMASVEHLSNLFCVNRTETDIATLAGIEAAEAVQSGSREVFDLHVDPAELNIRSESKAFSFDLPVMVQP